MSAMPSNDPSTADLQDAARRVLEEAGRPLSARRIQQMMPEPAPDLDALKAALAAGATNGGGLREVRRGVFALSTGEPEPPPAPEDAGGSVEVIDDDEAPRRRRRRRIRPTELVGDRPAASLSVDDAVAEAEAEPDRDALRRKLWAKVRARAEQVVAQSPSGVGDDEDHPVESRPPEAEPAPAESTEVAPEPAVEVEVPAAREAAPAVAEEAPPASSAEVATDPKAALKAKLAARRRTPEKAELPEPVGGRQPYVERRVEEAPAPPEEQVERRAPELPELAPTNALVQAAVAALRESGVPLSVDALAERVGAQGLATTGLRAALLAENTRCASGGLRSPFVIRYAGTIALSEWGLSARYRALETSVQASLAEQREIVRRDLLARVGELGDRAFEQVVVMMLEQLGYENVAIVHRQRGGNLALRAARDEGGGPEITAVVARRSWNSMKPDTVVALRDSLDHFSASRGLLITMGTFSRAARREASRGDRPVVHLVDGAGLARLLFEHGVGLSSHRPLVSYVDVAFFESLE